MEKRNYKSMPSKMTWTPPKEVMKEADRIANLETYIIYLASEVDKLIGATKEEKPNKE
jgi:hypothetical protein